MAEFVEFRCEEWVSELENLKRIRLFEPKEIKSLVTKRREFEYKIERRSKSKDDFLRYIQFEVDLLRIISARREKTGITGSKGSIEFKQINRVVRLFKQIIFRYPDDIKLWMSLFKFCTDVKHHSVVSKMLVRMLQHNSGNEELWLYASKWTMEHEKSVSNARQFLTKGLRHHPTSEKIYLELFRLELEHMKKKIRIKEWAIKKNKWEPNEVTENIINGKVVDVIYKSVIKVLESSHTKAALLNIAKDYPEAVNIHNTIVHDLIELHPDDEITWDAIAKCEYNGLDCNWDLLKVKSASMDVEKDNEKKEGETIVLRGKIEKSIDIYEEAVKKLNTEKMWNFYLDHVMEIYVNSALKQKLPVSKSEILQNAMEGALNSNHLSEKYLIQWTEILTQMDNKSSKVKELLLKGVQMFPESLPLWHALIRFHLSQDEAEKGKQLLKEAKRKVTDCLPLWQLVIEYLKLKNSPDIEEIFKDGMKQKEAISQAVKPIYLEWLAKHKGIGEAREVFETTDMQHPPCLNVYKTMAKVEADQPDYCSNRVRRCYDLLTLYFGRDDPSVWLEFITWEMKKGDALKVHTIHNRAVKSLIPEKVDEFVTEYNFIKLNADS